MSSIKQQLWVAAVAVGLIFVISGAVMLWQGNVAKGDVKAGLQAEAVTTGADAELFGVAAGLPVDSPETAWAQAETIHYHSLKGEAGVDKQVVDGKIIGGIPYSGMEREDPARATYLNGVALRTALTQAYMGFKVADLVMGVGAAFVLVGLSVAGLLGPALYWAANAATVREESRATAQQPLSTPAKAA